MPATEDDPHAAKLDAILTVLHRHRIRVLGVVMAVRHGKSSVQYHVETEPAEDREQRLN